MTTAINLRATAGYVTDDAVETYCLGEAYPTTRGGVTFGFASSQTANSRDRSSAGDRRLAGIVFRINSLGTIDFTVDLPSTGTYDIRIALGDASGAQNQLCVIKDNTTTLATINAASTSGFFRDAAGVEYSAAGWPGSNSAASLTFATTKLVLTLGNHSSATLSTTLAHISFVLTSGGGGGGADPAASIVRAMFGRAHYGIRR